MAGWGVKLDSCFFVLVPLSIGEKKVSDLSKTKLVVTFQHKSKKRVDFIVTDILFGSF